MSLGKLYIVATPIGNIKDITLRALEVLKSVDLILSEDTRETAKILNEYTILTPQIPYTDQKHDRLLATLEGYLDSGKSLALVTDNGTPVISDPGYKLVYELRSKNYEIEAIPGPSTVIAALSVSGLPTDKFSFIGFLPKTKSKRSSLIKEFGDLEATLTIFESPFRVRRLLQEIYTELGNRRVFIAKDLTKQHQLLINDTLENVIAKITTVPEKGEYTILIAKKGFN